MVRTVRLAGVLGKRSKQVALELAFVLGRLRAAAEVARARSAALDMPLDMPISAL